MAVSVSLLPVTVSSAVPARTCIWFQLLLDNIISIRNNHLAMRFYNVVLLLENVYPFEYATSPDNFHCQYYAPSTHFYGNPHELCGIFASKVSSKKELKHTKCCPEVVFGGLPRDFFYWPTRLWKPVLKKLQLVLSNQTFSEWRASINLILPLHTAKGDIPWSWAPPFATVWHYIILYL